MIRFLRFGVSFVAATFWHGGSVLVAGVFRVRHTTGGVYDRAARSWGRAMLQGTGLGVQVEGRERLDASTPKVYISNHASFIDIWALLQELPGTVRFVFKKEFLYIPILGMAMRAARHIPIDRGNRASAFASYEEAARLIRSGVSAVVFAEGTRSRNGRLQPFKKGPFVLAIAAQAPVVPVFCADTFEKLPKGSLRPKPGMVSLRIGEAIPTAGLGYEDRDGLAGRCREAMLALGARE